MKYYNKKRSAFFLADMIIISVLLSGCEYFRFDTNIEPSSSGSISSSVPSISSSADSVTSSTDSIYSSSSSDSESSSPSKSNLTCSDFILMWRESGGKASKNETAAQAFAAAKKQGVLPAGVNPDTALTVEKAAYILKHSDISKTHVVFSHYDWQLSDLKDTDSKYKKELCAAYADGLIKTQNMKIKPNAAVSKSEADDILSRLKEPKKRMLPPDCAAPYFEYQGLTELLKLDSTFIIDQRYATKNNFTGVIHYKNPICLLEADTAKKLVSANAYFRKMGYTIKIWDAYRPESVQWSLYRATPANLKQYAPAPSKNSQHSKGIAADITLVDKNGKEIDMPTGFDNFTEKAHSGYSNLPQNEINNRKLLKTGMTAQSFAQSTLEWWHFYMPSKTSLSISKVELEDFIHKQNEFYQNYISEHSTSGR